MAFDESLELEVLDRDSPSESKQEVKNVVWSLLYGGEEDRLRAAKEIRRSTKNSAKSRAYLAAAGVVSPLVSMLRSPSAEAKEASVLALLNLAVRNERNKIRIVKAGAILPLIDLLRLGDQSLRESAAAVVLTLSASNGNKPLIGASGVIPLLVEMLTSGSIQGKVDAIMALYNLSAYQENIIQILSAGAVSPLILLLKDCKKSSKVAERTTALLKSLSAFEDGRLAIVKEDGGVLALVEVIEEGSLQSREYAVHTLLTICQSSSNYRQALLQEGIIPGLLELTVQGTTRAQQDAHILLQLLRNSYRDTYQPSRTASASVLESLVYDIASQVDGGEVGTGSAKQMLTEMVQLSMEQSMQHLQQRAVPLSMEQSMQHLQQRAVPCKLQGQAS